MKPLTHQALKEELDQTLSTLAGSASAAIEVAREYHQYFLTATSQEDIEDAEDLYLVRTIATLMLGAGINYKAVEILLGEETIYCTTKPTGLTTSSICSAESAPKPTRSRARFGQPTISAISATTHWLNGLSPTSRKLDCTCPPMANGTNTASPASEKVEGLTNRASPHNPTNVGNTTHPNLFMGSSPPARGARPYGHTGNHSTTFNHPQTRKRPSPSRSRERGEV